MGHALQLALGDALVPAASGCRATTSSSSPATTTPASRRRTRSRSTCAREGKTRQELGREAFEARVWEWLREYGGKIMTQFRRMGASLDYRRERFTMDDGYVRAVMRFFVHLYEQGLDLPREPDHQLVPVPPDVALRPRARPRRASTTRSTTIRYPFVGRLGLRRDRDRAAGDDPGRRRRRRPSRTTSATRDVDRQGGDRPVRRAARARDRRRARRPRVRHRRAQGDARPRPDRLRDRPRPRAARADGDRARRAHERARPASSPGSRRRRRRSGSSPGARSAACSRSASPTGTRSRSASAARAGSSR